MQKPGEIIEVKSVYAVLSAIDCRKESKKKNGLTYLPWAWAWARVKENFPAAFYTVYENKDGFNYHHDGKTAWVKCGVTIDGIEMCEYLPVMDFRNASIHLDKITSFDVNKSIQRCLTKACARHGLGLYIFAGEDLPEGADDATAPETSGNRPVATPKASTTTATPPAAKATHNGSTDASAVKVAAKAAWDVFVESESGRSMDENSRKTFFKTYVKSIVGDKDLAKISVAEWNQVYARIKANKEG